MAKKIQHVWGLEIGQSALKGLRCHLDGDKIITDTFDFVEYPKILSQPEADPELLIADAMQQFMSRNDLRGARVGVSVPGQSGLAKFFKPPPVEVKKIGDIVKYEAKQQIPFDLNDVIWDFQQMEGAQIEDGYALESEVGLFAMKRDAVFRSLKPFREKLMDLDLVQLAPMSIYNMIAYDKYADRMASEPFDSENPHKSIVVLSIGTDASDLIVTNGFRVWQRSIPIGGNHFTRQLTKDLKLTFAKAEHLKRNAMQADDPKLVFQAMRPVFNDMVTEIQRSLNFFKTLNKKSELESILLLGNTAKLPGLQQFINKNLGMDVEILDKYPKLEGTEVTGAQAFKENAAAFGVVYGICLQLLKKGPMRTNLLPREIAIDRVVRMKKPWTVGALSLLLVGMVTNHATMGRVLSVVDEAKWKSSEDLVSSVSKESANELSEDSTRKNKLALFQRVGDEVSAGASRRAMSLDLCKAIEASLNRDKTLMEKTPIELPYSKRKDFHIKRVEQKFVKDFSMWFNADVANRYKDQYKTRLQLLESRAKPTKTMETAETAESSETPAEPLPPTGQGWVVEIEGFHYFNGAENKGLEGEAHVLKYFVDFLENGSIVPPIKESVAEYSLRDLGVRLPVVRSVKIDKQHRIPNPEYYRRLSELGLTSGAAGGMGSGSGFEYGGASSGGKGGGPGGMGAMGGMGGMGGPGGEAAGGYGGYGGAPTKPVLDEDGKEIPMDFAAEKCDFIVQFAWRSRFEKGGGKELDGGFPVAEVAAEPTDASASAETTGDPATVPDPAQQ
jgi:type IV pilus assembly protein PilM